MGADPLETTSRGKPIEIQIPLGKEVSFSERIEKIERVVGDLTGTNDGFRNQRIGEIVRAEKSTARKNTMLDVREFEPFKQRAAYIDSKGNRTERSIVYFRKIGKDMSEEFAVDENGKRLALDTALYDAAPKSGAYEPLDNKHKARAYPVFGENGAIERTITIFENDLDYIEKDSPVGETATPKETTEATTVPEEDVLSRNENLIKKNHGLVVWFYKTCQSLGEEEDISKRIEKYNSDRKKIVAGGMPEDLLDLITNSSELILSTPELDASKSGDKAGEILKGMSDMSAGFESVVKARVDFLRLRIMVVENGGEMRTGDKQYLSQLKADLAVMQKGVKPKK